MKSKFKYIIIVLFIIAVGLFFAQRTADIEAVTKVKLDEVTKIKLYYGRPGQAGVTITDKQTLSEFKKLLENYKLMKMQDQPVIAGYYQAGILYKDDTEVMRITFGNPIEINGIYYKVISGNLKSNKIDEFMK